MTIAERVMLVCMKNAIKREEEEKTRIKGLLYPDETKPTREEIEKLIGNPFHGWSREELIELLDNERPDGL